MTPITRPLQEGDLQPLQVLLTTIDLFPADMLGDLVAGYLSGGAAQVWHVACDGDDPVALCFAEPEPLTDGTWNMRALGVHADHQRKGHGARLVAGLEHVLIDAGARMLIVDTASGDALQPARAFYAARGYDCVAQVPGFWDAGTDKVIFSKMLV